MQDGALCKVDLHIHTILSPCAEVEMIPPFIIKRAIDVGLDLIAITDHNSAENVESVINAAQGTSVRVIPGMECETLEGVHVVCLFNDIDSVMDMQAFIYSKLPNMPNKPDIFGAQFVVDETGDFIRYNERLLLVSTQSPLEEIVAEAEMRNGFAIPAHVDRRAYGIYGVLGFLPEYPVFKAVEISHHITPDEARLRYPDLGSKLLLQSSDAHRLDEIGCGYSMLELPHRDLASIKQLANQYGR